LVEKDEELVIDFQNFALGDPCFKSTDKNPSSICQNNGVCNAFGPSGYFCNCVDKKFGGINCEQENICALKVKYYIMRIHNLSGYYQ
jgi:hypothetical protein